MIKTNSRRFGRRGPALARMDALEVRLALSTVCVTPTPDDLSPGSIRDAIQEANASPGSDRILLRPGVYALSLAGADEDAGATGDLDILGDLTLQGVDSETTIIDASALGDRALDVLAASLTLKNLTIRGGRAEQGGAIRVLAGSLAMTNCRLSDNIAQGVYDSDADSGAGQGGAIYQALGSMVLMQCRFTGNQAIGADATDVRTSANGEGGAVYLGGTRAIVSNCRFEGNQATGGAGSAAVAFVGGTGRGGAIAFSAGAFQATNTFFTGNIATGGAGADDCGPGGGGAGLGAGGAIDAQGVDYLSLANCTLQDNLARGGQGGSGMYSGVGGPAYGGAIFNAYASALAMTKCNVRGNQAIGGQGGDGLLSGALGGTGAGGALYATGKVVISIAKCAFRDNQAIGGRGGDGITGGGGQLGQGGAIWVAGLTGNPARVSLSSTTLSGNQALGGTGGSGADGSVAAGGPATGGAIAIGNVTDVLITRSDLRSNAALGGTAASGGAIDITDATLTFASGTLADNRAVSSVGSYGAGGAVSAGREAGIRFDNARIERNVARGGDGAPGIVPGSGQGGGVFMDTNGKGASRSTVFQANQAIGGQGAAGMNGGQAMGGAIATLKGLLAINHCTFSRNTAIGGPAGEEGVQGMATGGAIHCDPALSMVMQSSTVVMNRAVGAPGQGGGIYLAGDLPARIVDSTVARNVASTEGDDIFGPYITELAATARKAGRKVL